LEWVYLGICLSLKAGIPYEQLVKDRILDVLGMNDIKITLSANEIKTRLPQGHEGGKEIKAPDLPKVLAGTGLFRSTVTDMLKFVSANLGLINTKLENGMQLTHLIRHPAITANPMNYSEYVELGWHIATNFGSEVFSHSGSINGWNAFIGFIPAKQIGVVLLCSCDSKDADMNNVGFVLLHLSGPETLTAKTESRFHTTPALES
jgi:D-alanyl-D-alanine-carboxypeptidase/D-alanyl-D-alanine-endopeptidase